MAAIDDALVAKNKAITKAAGLLEKLRTFTPGSKAYVDTQKLYNDAKTDRDKKIKVYNDLKDTADTRATAAQSEAENAAYAQTNVDNFIDLQETSFKNLQKKYQNDPNDSGKSSRYLTALTELDKQYAIYEAKGYKFNRLVIRAKNGDIVPATQTVASAPAVTTAAAPTVTATGGGVKVLGRQQRGESVTAEPVKVVVTGNKTVVFTKADVDAKLVELNLTDTPENRKTARQALKAAKPVGKPVAKPAAVTAVDDKAWEAIFKKNYPQYNWMFTDLDRTKYADVFTLFSSAIDTKTGKSLMPDEEFNRRWIGTSFYRELESSKKGRELSAAIGTFSWGSGNLAKFLTKAIQYGYTGENLKQQAYTDLFSKVGDKYANENAVGEVRASSPYLALKRIGTQYLQPFADDTIEKALSGGETADDLLRKARVIAAEQYPHLKNAINAGVTLEELAANYKKIASETLELDPSQIDMNGIYNVALKTGEGGKERMMSYSEWQTMLRTDPKYKYSFTKQANQDATDIGLSIARAFGKVG